ncbi:Wadjet anti-phage system protein JetD domain-containing protein [Agromyces italicus]|uniref:Wadjet anti-phage system protein JetD domain-containing protein n=1 Tax=Agromyces italicus TaxID=279572 RepID=UPI0003B63F24|nr:DUF3322 and DUF2220 domain-containing protein [Agromyces italicus]
MLDTVEAIRAVAWAAFEAKLPGWVQSREPVAVKFTIRGYDAAEFERDADVYAANLGDWDRYAGPGAVESVRRKAGRSGVIDVPVRIRFAGAADVAEFAGRSSEWAHAARRVDDLRSRWPVAHLTPGLLRKVLGFSDEDWATTVATLEWTELNDPTGLFARQLPVPGADTKWVQRHWPTIVLLSKSGARRNPEALGELRDIEPMTFVRLLDDRLRQEVGGLGTFAAAPSELGNLTVTPDTVIICENLTNGRSFTDRPGTAVLAGKGNDVVSYADLPWVRAARVVYWGDIDTWGFQILDRFRAFMPAQSILMDAATLHRNRAAWAIEKNPTNVTLARMEPEEAEVYDDLVAGTYGPGVRLEQERIPWADVTAALDLL